MSGRALSAILIACSIAGAILAAQTREEKKVNNQTTEQFKHRDAGVTDQGEERPKRHHRDAGFVDQTEEKPKHHRDAGMR